MAKKSRAGMARNAKWMMRTLRAVAVKEAPAIHFLLSERPRLCKLHSGCRAGCRAGCRDGMSGLKKRLAGADRGGQRQVRLQPPVDLHGGVTNAKHSFAFGPVGKGRDASRSHP